MIRIRAIKDLLKLSKQEVVCEIDEDVVECSEMNTPPYTGVPAPAYLEYDEWFEQPVLSEKQQEIRDEDYASKVDALVDRMSVTKEPENIHDLMYDVATKNTPQLGGSENLF
jgi:hypothetical protein|tara:strand:- start:424 stop:759 length:336 start_codon:yes stop_codon:yes gene_type:complete